MNITIPCPTATDEAAKHRTTIEQIVYGNMKTVLLTLTFHCLSR